MNQPREQLKFYLNKKILPEVGEIASMKIRNRIAGFATHMLKRIQTGPVKNFTLKVQEKERKKTRLRPRQVKG